MGLPVRIADPIHCMNYISIANPNGNCLSSLGYILIYSQDKKSIYSAQTSWASAFRLFFGFPEKTIFPIRIADPISYMHYIMTTNPNGSCLSSLGFISKNSQNYRNIYSVETFSCFRLHAKSKKSKFSKNFNQFLSSVPQPESPLAKNKTKKKKLDRFLVFRRLLFCISNNT